ncbi:iron-containing alcohol dehydrogenase [Candidatus Phycosocius spiralis]|uniref:Iron-containing alcohol dehydrogenase n=1 Tax=Candidatus Phycosocius spiralis TaxID=2815099 RepID=A0ABQ4PTB0_9PROT|nr:iron-containing alcohol dehydrogenase [Candidatus Phycosocius spiralis]GIU66240.1 iron-containing alcohol dehydrogenase [Candidatus Phycosocius spiralis]
MANIPYLTDLRFDHGAINQIGKALQSLGASRPLIVTDKGVVAAGLLQRLLDALDAFDHPIGPAAIFDETPGNPTEAATINASQLYQSCGADSLIALGGGSAMDLAKGVGLLVHGEGPLARFGTAQRGSRLIGKIPPLIAIPTTSGTGSEVSIGAIIVLASGEKELFVSKFLIPSIALCDPELTLGLPAGLTAATGMDAVTHCIESILSPTINPPADAIAADGISRAVGEGMLARAVKDGGDRDARWHMMMASTEGALAFVKGLGSVHALSHAAGRLKSPSLHHGTLNAIFLPHVMKFNAGANTDGEARIRHAMGLNPGADLFDALSKLNQDLGIPANLSELGLTDDHADGIVCHALLDIAHLTNPKTTTQDDYHALYRAALYG